jgi:hypothetical protein
LVEGGGGGCITYKILTAVVTILNFKSHHLEL